MMTAATTPGADPTDRLHAVLRRLARNRPERRVIACLRGSRLLDAVREPACGALPAHGRCRVATNVLSRRHDRRDS